MAAVHRSSKVNKGNLCCRNKRILFILGMFPLKYNITHAKFMELQLTLYLRTNSPKLYSCNVYAYVLYVQCSCNITEHSLLATGGAVTTGSPWPTYRYCNIDRKHVFQRNMYLHIHIRQSIICYTSGTLKSVQNLTSIFPSVYIVTDSDYDCGSWF